MPAVTPTEADQAYIERNFGQAEGLYRAALASHPADIHSITGLTETLLHEDDVTGGAAVLKKALPANPSSAALMTALAEVQLRQGQPWLALQTLASADAIDPCLARTHLIRSRVFRLDSMYASERKEIESAYRIDPADPDIRHAWTTVVSPAKDIESIRTSLLAMKDIDPEVQMKAEASAQAMLPLLSENSQTCRIQPAQASAELPLLPSLQDGKHIDGFRLEVQFPKTKARLQVDTAASGIYISRALAEANSFEAAAGSPSGTVHAPSVRIGPLEFRDCVVGVSDAPFPGKADGFIGTDLFASYLITLNHPLARLSLAALPVLSTSLPSDRPLMAEHLNFVPVYHRLQFLLVPVIVNNKERRLFVLDSGIRLSTMTLELAHAVSSTKVNFTNAVQTTTGGTLQLYRDNFDLRFANLSLHNWGHVLEFDPATIQQNTGLTIGGLLGFDILQTLILHLDYRDGLVQLEPSDPKIFSVEEPLLALKQREPLGQTKDLACVKLEGAIPSNSTIQAHLPGLLDSRQLKSGDAVFLQVSREWSDGHCRLAVGSALYGHVMQSESSRQPESSRLAIAFDSADCAGRARSQLSIHLVALFAAPDDFRGVHNSMPTKLSGSGRQMATTVASMGSSEDSNMNPGGPPESIRTGFVGGIPGLNLTPDSGPSCSALLSSPERSVKIGVGTTLVFAEVQQPQ